MQVKLFKCSGPEYWYFKRVGEYFEVVVEDGMYRVNVDITRNVKYIQIDD